MDNITFKSDIRFVPLSKFNKYVNSFGSSNCVNYPWTVEQSVLSQNAYTKFILDCTAVGITDGSKVLLMHLCPTRQENKIFRNIENYIESKINMMDKHSIQGFLLGSRNVAESRKLFDNILNLLKKLNISVSYFKNSLYENNISYSSITDEWLISNSFIKQNNDVENYINSFAEVKISTSDKIV